jgi:hypothetical protein
LNHENVHPTPEGQEDLDQDNVGHQEGGNQNQPLDHKNVHPITNSTRGDSQDDLDQDNLEHRSGADTASSNNQEHPLELVYHLENQAGADYTSGGSK